MELVLDSQAAGRVRFRSVPGHKGPPVRQKHRRKRAHNMTLRRIVWAEVQELCADDRDVVVNATPPEAIQYLLNRAMGALYAVAAMSDDVPIDKFWVSRVDAWGNVLVEPNKWYKLEMALREEVRLISSDMARLGIADRLASVEEAKAAWVLAAIRSAASDAGLSNDQVRLLGEGIRRHLAESEAVPEPGVSVG